MNAKMFLENGREFRKTVLSASLDELARARSEVQKVEKKLSGFKTFDRWYEYLTNGETMGGLLGICGTFGFFVRSYASKKEQDGRPDRLTSVDLLILPEVLEAHTLRVDVPNPKRPGTLTNTSAMVGVPDIVKRMVAHGRSATNVSPGSFEDVLNVPCDHCQKPALVAAIDEYLDQDNGQLFQVACLCVICHRTKILAEYAHYKPCDQFGYTQSVYQHAP